MNLCCTCLLALLVLSCSAIEREFEIEELKPRNNADDHQEIDIGSFSSDLYIDKLLDSVRYGIRANNLDPLALPTKQKSFKKVLWKHQLSGGVRLEDGILKGLSTIDRKGRTDVKHGKGGKMVIEANLYFNYLTYSSDISVWFSIFKIRGSMSAMVSSVTVYVRFSQDTHGGHKDKPYLEEVDIRDIGKIRSTVKGLGTLGWTLTTVTDFLANILKKVIANKIEGPIEKLIRKNLHHIDFSV